MNIYDYINWELEDADRENASELIHFLEDKQMSFYKDNSVCWKDKIYYWIKYGETCVAYISIKDPDEKNIRWTVWSDDVNSEWLEQNCVNDKIKIIAWKNIDFCCNCGSCGGGRRKNVFGKEFDNVCGCTFRVDNPGADDISFIKEMISICVKMIK